MLEMELKDFISMALSDKGFRNWLGIVCLSNFQQGLEAASTLCKMENHDKAGEMIFEKIRILNEVNYISDSIAAVIKSHEGALVDMKSNCENNIN